MILNKILAKIELLILSLQFQESISYNKIFEVEILEYNFEVES